jgi:hypothetical protein
LRFLRKNSCNDAPAAWRSAGLGKPTVLTGRGAAAIQGTLKKKR